MPHFLTQYWQARKRFTSRSTAASDPPPAEETSRAEQLENIAAYARAGYFNMGYTVDAFQLPSDPPMH